MPQGETDVEILLTTSTVGDWPYREDVGGIEAAAMQPPSTDKKTLRAAALTSRRCAVISRFEGTESSGDWRGHSTTTREVEPMGLLSDLYRSSRFGSSEADDPSTSMTGPVDPLDTSLSGSMAALVAQSLTNGAHASPDPRVWSMFAAASPPAASAPRVNDAITALARAWIGLDTPASNANGNQARYQLAADQSLPSPFAAAGVTQSSSASNQIAQVDRARKDYCVPLCTKLTLMAPGPGLSRQANFERCLAHCEGRSFWPQFESRIPFPG